MTLLWHWVVQEVRVVSICFGAGCTLTPALSRAAGEGVRQDILPPPQPFPEGEGVKLGRLLMGEGVVWNTPSMDERLVQGAPAKRKGGVRGLALLPRPFGERVGVRGGQSPTVCA